MHMRFNEDYCVFYIKAGEVFRSQAVLTFKKRAAQASFVKSTVSPLFMNPKRLSLRSINGWYMLVQRAYCGTYH